MTKKQKEFINNLIKNYDTEGRKEFEDFLKKNSVMPAVYEVNPDNPQKAQVKCYSCGFSGEIDATALDTCPKCGRELRGNNYSEFVYNKLLTEENSLILMRYQAEIRASLTDCETDIELTDIVEFNNDIKDISCFTSYGGDWCKKMPKYVYSYGSVLIHTNVTKEKEKEYEKKFPEFMKRLPDGGYYDKMETRFEWKDLPYRMSRAYKDAISYKEMTKVTKAKKEIEVPDIKIPKFNPKDIETQASTKTKFKINQEGLVYVAICGHCGERIVLPDRYAGIEECPNCKRTTTNASTYGYLLKTNLEENGNLLVLLYSYNLELKEEENDYKYKFSNLDLRGAFYATEKETFFYEEKDNKLKATTCSEINSSFSNLEGRYSYQKIKFAGGAKKVVDDFNNSVLNRTGYIEFCKNTTGFKDESEESLKDLAKSFAYNINYLNIFNNCKALEQLAKCGMTQLLKDITKKVSCPKYICKKETTPHKILNLTKAQFKELRAADVSQMEFESYKRILEADPNALYSDCTRFLHSYCNSGVDVILDVLGYNIPKINMKEIEKYAESLDQYQCMDWLSGLREWRDYLHMCQELKCDMNDRTVIFTNSLKLEHDRTVRKYNTLKNQKAIENFKDAVERYKYLEWESEDFDFKVVTPKTQEELYEEGRVLHHCVGSYAKSVAEGRSTIVFIRRKDKPDTPLCTVEVSGNRLVQARTKYNNHAYSVPGVKKFMQAWGKEKHIILTTR